MSQQVTPPQPPSQRKPTNWFSVGCYVAVAIVILLVILLFVGFCAGQGVHQRPT